MIVLRGSMAELLVSGETGYSCIITGEVAESG